MKDYLFKKQFNALEVLFLLAYATLVGTIVGLTH